MGWGEVGGLTHHLILWQALIGMGDGEPKGIRARRRIPPLYPSWTAWGFGLKIWPCSSVPKPPSWWLNFLTLLPCAIFSPSKSRIFHSRPQTIVQ